MTTPAAPISREIFRRLLLALALVPSAWKAAMLPAVARWRSQPGRPLSSGRALVCWNLYAGSGVPLR